ncbi:hypothetical protein KFU94_56150 [Chloroflexi bacterium TSY]|nr:hypothetical protein [Chloroflexi bacterium TSY]
MRTITNSVTINGRSRDDLDAIVCYHEDQSRQLIAVTDEVNADKPIIDQPDVADKNRIEL